MTMYYTASANRLRAVLPTWWLWLAVCLLSLLCLLRALRLRGLLLLGLSHALCSQAGTCLLQGWGCKNTAQKVQKQQVTHSTDNWQLTGQPKQAAHKPCDKIAIGRIAGSAALLTRCNQCLCLSLALRHQRCGGLGCSIFALASRTSLACCCRAPLSVARLRQQLGDSVPAQE